MKNIFYLLIFFYCLLLSSCSESTARKRCDYFARQTLSEVRALYPNVKITDVEVLYDDETVFVGRYHYGTEILPNYTEVNKKDMYSQVYVYFVSKNNDDDHLGVYSNSEFQQAYVFGQNISSNKQQALAEACRMLMLNKSRKITKEELRVIE